MPTTVFELPYIYVLAVDSGSLPSPLTVDVIVHFKQ